MSNEAERVAFKAKFRPRHDVREILERNSFTNAITEQMWWAFQAGAEWQRSQEQEELAELQVLLRKIWPLINGAKDAVHDEIKAALAKKELSE